MKKLIQVITVLLLAAVHSQLSICSAQGTAFTYQGRLNDGAAPATGIYDLRFAIYDAAGSGTQQGNTLTNVATAVSNGLFTVTLDFGDQFPGTDRWLEIGVRTNGGGAFSVLSPRQPLTATPYAVRAASATTAASASSVNAANISGTIPVAQLPASVVTNGASGVNFSGTFSGNGAGVTNVDLRTVNSLGALSYNTNNGIFILASSPGVGNTPRSVTSADVNGDGKPDLISANFGNTLTVLFNIPPFIFSGNFTGNGSGLTSISDSALSANVSKLGSTIESGEITDGTIVDADISPSAAIAYSELSLAGSITNGDIAASANIADTKLATISSAGKVADTALSTNVALLNKPNQTFTSANNFATTVKVGTRALADGQLVNFPVVGNDGAP
jgi:hypothetical protein